MNHQDLTQFGLSSDEAAVYLALLELGGGYASQIAKRAGCRRASCYYTLSNLLEKGLAARLEKGSYQYFSPEPPTKLVKQQQEKLEAARALMPELESICNTLARKPRVKFFEGRRGIEDILQGNIVTENEAVGFTNIGAMLKLFPSSFKEHIRQNLIRGVRLRFIAPRLQKSEKIRQKLALGKEASLLEILFVNEHQFPFDNEISIYGNTVIIMSLSEREMMAVLIESPVVANSMRSVFNLSWLGATSFIAM